MEPRRSVHCSGVCHVHFLSHALHGALDLCPVASETQDPVRRVIVNEQPLMNGWSRRNLFSSVSDCQHLPRLDAVLSQVPRGNVTVPTFNPEDGPGRASPSTKHPETDNAPPPFTGVFRHSREAPESSVPLLGLLGVLVYLHICFVCKRCPQTLFRVTG